MKWVEMNGKYRIIHFNFTEKNFLINRALQKCRELLYLRSSLKQVEATNLSAINVMKSRLKGEMGAPI
jgi:hypothetical protein